MQQSPTNCIARSIRQYGEVQFNFIEPPEGFIFAVGKIIGTGGFPNYKKPARECIASMDDLRITRVERDRFEQEYGLGKPAQMPTINEDTELKRAYRALGALAMQLAKEKTNLTNGGKPNVSQIAEYALKAVSDCQGKAPHGYGNTTLEKAITTALDTVKKDLSNR